MLTSSNLPLFLLLSFSSSFLFYLSVYLSPGFPFLKWKTEKGFNQKTWKGKTVAFFSSFNFSRNAASFLIGSPFYKEETKRILQRKRVLLEQGFVSVSMFIYIIARANEFFFFNRGKWMISIRMKLKNCTY